MRQTPFTSAAGFLGPAIACLQAVSAAGTASASEPLRFNRDIRPILADHCFACHGPDANNRRAGLRLDDGSAVLHPAESGRTAIVPGQPDASELIRRIECDDPEERMPPPEVEKLLSKAQSQTLRRWVEQGARYEPHWALLPPVRPPLPPVRDAGWPRNEIDCFVLAKLEEQGLEPSPEADPAMLVRRLSLDLTGLPPAMIDPTLCATESPEDARAATAAARDSPAIPQQDARAGERVYQQWIDRLLGSPHYGERMAVDWLDAARFADSNGYQVDRDREMYAWRDWVIDAFNANMPFDQFTIEQLAGDLLPDATLSQRIATGFGRNHMLNEEGGVIAEEFLVEYCADRVETMATIWLGQTFTCCRCHDHKFDPFTQRDYYGLFAFFHSVAEQGLGDYGAHIRRNAPPILQLPSPALEARLAELRRQRGAMEKRLAELPAGEHPDRGRWTEEVARLSKEIDETELQIPTTLVMEELPSPRPTHILIRGAYDRKGAQVDAATPSALPPMPDDAPRNRLGLSRWLVDTRQPLTARVTVNRLWQSLFGTGLVRTAEDFGTQGDPASHPELLDWLATELVRREWDIKSMVRLLVGSSTYRQSSRITEVLRERDPQNQWLARGPRFRLHAEFVRDQALAAGGLLVTRVGGPSVKPYHPPGLYEQVVAGKGPSTYVMGSGADLFRRSLYTYWKRSVPHPAMLVFDAPFRETCSVRRSRTNTPLQALNLMNDPTYVEASRSLAQRMIRTGGGDTCRALSHGAMLVLGRLPSRAELDILASLHRTAADHFQHDPAAAEALVGLGTSPRDSLLVATEVAAMTTVASTILICDEALTKE
jgi:mono/diheme cytochrome c family protein